MPIVLANNVASTVALDLTSTAGSVRVASGTGSRFPTLPSGSYFYATLVATDGRFEIVKVTRRTGDLLTISRAQENTLASAFPVGSRLELRTTAKSITDAIDEVRIHVGTSPPNNPTLNMLWVDTN